MGQLITKHIINNKGERFKVLTDESTGIPLYFPNLYVTSQMRGAAKSIASIQSFITAIKQLYAWCEYYSLDVEDRLRKGNWLTVWEIDSLRDFFSLSLTKYNSNSKKIVKLSNHSNTKSVSAKTKYIRMTYAAEYIRWLSEVICHEGSRRIYEDEFLVMYKRIKMHRPKIKGRSEKAKEDKGLDSDALNQILEITKPGNERNPYHGYALQSRNALIFTLLRYLGIRRGELLNLRIDDINFIKNEIQIIRRADSETDVRVYQPLVKTLERVLPISEKLAEKLAHYVTNVRSRFIKAKRHPYLFVTHKKGPNEGDPLSNSGFGKMMTILQGSLEGLYGIHAHMFRHSWNYEFSQSLDNSDKQESPEKEEQMRSYLMGWEETSGTAATYNKRHIKEKAKLAILEFQSSIAPEKKKEDVY